MPRCNLCDRELDNIGDPLSEDCGGDCTACMIEVEGSDVWEYFVIQLRDRILKLESLLEELKNANK